MKMCPGTTRHIDSVVLQQQWFSFVLLYHISVHSWWVTLQLFRSVRFSIAAERRGRYCVPQGTVKLHGTRVFFVKLLSTSF